MVACDGIDAREDVAKIRLSMLSILRSVGTDDPWGDSDANAIELDGDGKKKRRAADKVEKLRRMPVEIE